MDFLVCDGVPEATPNYARSTTTLYVGAGWWIHSTARSRV